MQKKKTILFMAPDYYGFNEVVKNGLVKYSNAQVYEIISNEPVPYLHFGERVKNFFSKNLLGVNIKKQKKEKRYVQLIDSIKNIDYFIANRPDLIDVAVMNAIKKKTKKSIAIFWDSMEKIPMQKRTIKDFDICYSFDEEDCRKYGFRKNTNFYFANPGTQKTEYDVVFFGTYDKRFPAVLKVIHYLENAGKSIKAFIYVPPGLKKPDGAFPSVKFLTEQIPFKNADQIASLGKVILDIRHENQTGLSFRPFEAMALQRKLITDNPEIRKYNFYDEQNIHVIIDINNIEIPQYFFHSPYKVLPDHILHQYSQRAWVQNILL